MKPITRDRLSSELVLLDTGFYNVELTDQHGWKKLILFYGKCEHDPFIHLKIDKKDISIQDGFMLTSQEKKKKWMFKNFHTIEELAEDIVNFTLKYSQSFEIVIKRK